MTGSGRHRAENLAGDFDLRGNGVVGAHGEQPAWMGRPGSIKAQCLEDLESFGQFFFAQFHRLLEPSPPKFPIEAQAVPEIGEHPGGVPEKPAHHPAQDHRFPWALRIAEVQEWADGKYRHLGRNPTLAQEILHQKPTQGPSCQAGAGWRHGQEVFQARFAGQDGMGIHEPDVEFRIGQFQESVPALEIGGPASDPVERDEPVFVMIHDGAYVTSMPTYLIGL